MFGKRKRKNPAKEPEPGDAEKSVAPPSPRVAEAKANGEASDETGSDPVIPADRALDFMADLLRILGENPFDVGPHNKDEIKAFFETWARHLLVGVAPPNRERVVEGGGCTEPLLHAS